MLKGNQIESRGGTKSITNPHKVNQYTDPDPRQASFLSFYLDPKSPTYSNILQSGLRAGYSQQTSESIMSRLPKWLSESLGEMNLLGKAVRNINQTLDVDPVVQAMSAFGPVFEKKVEKKRIKLKNGKYKIKTKIVNGKPIMVINPKLLAIRESASEFIAETLGSEKFSKKPGTIMPIQFNFGSDRDKY